MRTIHAVLSAALVLVTGCGGGGGGSGTGSGTNAAPVVSLSEPAASISWSRGSPVSLVLVASDADDVATTSIFADADGDLATTGDRYLVASGLADTNGAPLEVTWDSAGTPAGVYRIVASTTDGHHAPVTAIAAGSVTLTDVGFVLGVGGAGSGALTIPTDIASFADDSWTAVGYFTAEVTFGAGEPNAVTFVPGDSGTNAFIARYFADGQLVWARSVAEAIATGVTAVSDGSVLVCGTIHGATTFGLGEPNETVLTPTGSEEGFVARFSSMGSLEWARRVGDVGDVHAGLASYADGSCVLTANFAGTVTFGAGEVNETVLTSAGANDLFVARYSADGDLVWAKRAGSGLAAGEDGVAVSILADGTAVVVGTFAGSVADPAKFGPGEANETLLVAADPPTGGSDIFIARYEANGDLRWVRRAGGTLSDSPTSVGAYGDGSFVVAGYFQGTATFGPGEPGSTVLTSLGSDAFVAKFEDDGDLVWVRSAGPAFAKTVGLFPDGSVFVAGAFQGTVTFGEGEPQETVLTAEAEDGFLARYAANGDLKWASRIGGAGNSDQVFCAASLSDGSLLVAGWFQGTCYFSPPPPAPNPVFLVATGGLFDAFFARFNGDGEQ